MEKFVNVYPGAPILDLNIPIRTASRRFYLDSDSIRKCLLKGAIVEEILSNGTTVNLDLNNYNKDNNPVVIIEIKPEEPKVEKEVVNTEEKVEESKQEEKADEISEVKPVEQPIKKYNKNKIVRREVTE